MRPSVFTLSSNSTLFFYNSSTLFQKIATNTLSQVFSKFVTAWISIVLLGILTKYLPLEMFGMYNKIYNYLWIFAFLADLGLYTIAIREITENKKNTKAIIGNVLTLRVVLWVVIFFLALWIGLFLPWYNSPLGIASIWIVWIFTIISLINSSILALMQAYMKMEFSFLSVVMWKLLNIVLVSYIVFVAFPISSVQDFWIPLLYIFSAGLVGITFTTFLNYFYANAKIIPIRFAYDKPYITSIFQTSLPYGIALFLGVVYFKVDVILLSLIEPTNEADVSIALYSLPMKIVEVLMVLGWFYLNSILPSLTQAYKSADTRKMQQLIDVSLKVLLSFGLCIFVFGTLLRDNIIEIIANKNYLYGANHVYSSSDVFGIVLAVLLFHFISLVFIYILIGAKKQSKLLWINFIVTIFNIAGNMFLIPQYSFMWAGVVTVLSQILLLVLWYIVTRKIIKIKFDVVFYFWVIVFSMMMYQSFSYLLTYFPLWKYLNVFVYGWLWGMLFLMIVFSWIRQRSNKVS